MNTDFTDSGSPIVPRFTGLASCFSANPKKLKSLTISDIFQPCVHVCHLLSELLARGLLPKLGLAFSGYIADSCINHDFW